MERLSCKGFDQLMKDNKLDTLMSIGLNMSHVLAIGGYIRIIVPARYVLEDEMLFGVWLINYL